MCCLSCLRAGDSNLLVAGDNFHAFPFNLAGLAFQFPQTHLITVNLAPTIPVRVIHATLVQQDKNGLFIGLLGGVKMLYVFNDVTDSLQCITLGMTDQPNRTALDPTGGVVPLHGVSVGS